MVRPGFPPRPLGTAGILPPVSRPLLPVIPGVRPITPPVVRPAIVPLVTPAEKPQTTVYVGKIAATVDNDFMLSLLQVCYKLVFQISCLYYTEREVDDQILLILSYFYK